MRGQDEDVAVDPKKPVDPNAPKGPQIDIADLEIEDVPGEEIPADADNEQELEPVKWKRPRSGCGGGPDVDD